MPMITPLYILFGINSIPLSKEENLLLETELFFLVCDELKEIFREQHKEYFNLTKFTMEEENTMLESRLIHFIIQDILSTKQYDIEGIAYYTNAHIDILNDVYFGLNKYPSALLLRKIIEIHREVRQEIYQKIKQKLVRHLND